MADPLHHWWSRIAPTEYDIPVETVITKGEPYHNSASGDHHSPGGPPGDGGAAYSPRPLGPAHDSKNNDRLGQLKQNPMRSTGNLPWSLGGERRPS
jgi:hypothetical protein